MAFNPIDLPIWWSDDFILSQKEEAFSFQFDEVRLPSWLIDDEIQIGFKGPYSGAFSMVHSDISANLVEFTKLYSRKFDIRFRIPLNSHFEYLSCLHFDTLRSLGYQIQFKDLNYFVDLTQGINFNRNRLRDLKKSRNFNFALVTGDLKSAFMPIQKNRLQKMVPLSISFEFLNQLNISLSERLISYHVNHNSIPVCGAIGFRVDHNVLYIFMWGNDRDHQISGYGMTYLANSIFEDAISKGYKTICLGTSSNSGVLDLGLANFKTSLGAQPEDKITLILPKFSKY